MVELAPTGDGHFAKGYAGDTFNCAWYARKLLPADWSVAYGTALGQDAMSEEVAGFIAAQGIETDAIKRHPTRTVGLYMISLENGERSFSYWRGESAARTIGDDGDWLDQILTGCDVVQFSGITLGILAPATRIRLTNALQRARRRGARVVFDTNLRPRLWESEGAMREGLTMGGSVADVVLPSFDEEQTIFADKTPAETAARYARLGAEEVVVKNGAGAVHVWSDIGPGGDVTPPKVPDVVDSTAAGDSFAAGYVAARAQGAAPLGAAEAACALAARVIAHRGALAEAAISHDAPLTPETDTSEPA